MQRPERVSGRAHPDPDAAGSGADAGEDGEERPTGARRGESEGTPLDTNTDVILMDARHLGEHPEGAIGLTGRTFRFHVVSLPHSQTTKEYDTCAFTAKVRKFCDMMSSLGHEVILYAGDQNEAEVAELVTCITREEQQSLGIPGPERVFDASFDVRDPQWKTMNQNVIAGIIARKQPGDFLCVMGGSNHSGISTANPDLMCVEFGIGYAGSYAPYRVFESSAWMHATYGAQFGLAAANGRFYDAVIPSYFEEDMFPFGKGRGKYFLYIGRLTERKGLQVVKDVAERTGVQLVVAGDGDESLVPPGAEYVGHVNPSQRALLYEHAVATLVPTLYLEPFGSVAFESMMCGTPAITTDWGAFPEYVRQGVDGYRCRDLGEFTWAVKNAGKLDRTRISGDAIKRFGMANVRWRYQDYFSRLDSVQHGKGWYTENEREPGEDIARPTA